TCTAPGQTGSDTSSRPGHASGSPHSRRPIPSAAGPTTNSRPKRASGANQPACRPSTARKRCGSASGSTSRRRGPARAPPEGAGRDTARGAGQLVSGPERPQPGPAAQHGGRVDPAPHAEVGPSPHRGAADGEALARGEGEGLPGGQGLAVAGQVERGAEEHA